MGSANIRTPAVFNQTATTGCNIIGPLDTPQGEEFTHNKWAIYRSMLQSESAQSTILQPFAVGMLSLFIPSPNEVWYNNNTRLHHEFTQNYRRKNKEIKNVSGFQLNVTVQQTDRLTRSHRSPITRNHLWWGWIKNIHLSTLCQFSQVFTDHSLHNILIESVWYHNSQRYSAPLIRSFRDHMW